MKPKLHPMLAITAFLILSLATMGLALPTGSPDKQGSCSSKMFRLEKTLLENPQAAGGPQAGEPKEMKMRISMQGCCEMPGCCAMGMGGKMCRYMGGHKSGSCGKMGCCKDGPGGHMGKGLMIEGLMRKAAILGLSEEQKEELKEISYNAKMDLIDLKAKVAKEELHLKKLLHSEDSGLTSIKRQLEAVARARVNLEYQKISAMKEAKKVLTEEQRKKLKEMMPMHGRMCGPMMGGGTAHKPQ